MSESRIVKRKRGQRGPNKRLALVNMSRTTLVRRATDAVRQARRATAAMEEAQRTSESNLATLTGLLHAHAAAIGCVAAADHVLRQFINHEYPAGIVISGHDVIMDARGKTQAALATLQGTTNPAGNFAVTPGIIATLFMHRLVLAHPECEPVEIVVENGKIVAKELEKIEVMGTGVTQSDSTDGT